MEKQKVISDFAIHADKLDKIFDEDFVKDGLSEGNLPQKLLGVSDNVMLSYYTAATQLLDEKNWADACDAFTFLAFLNPTIPGTWLGLGIAEQWLEKYEAALLAYLMAEALDPKDPTPYGNACQCNLALGRVNEAKQLWDKAVDCCGDNPEHAELKEKLNNLKKFFNQ